MSLEPHIGRSLGVVGLLALRWGAVLCVFALLIGFGLFYSSRRQLGRLRGVPASFRGRLLDEEFREELRVSFEYLVLLATVPLLAAAATSVRALQRLLSARRGG